MLQDRAGTGKALGFPMLRWQSTETFYTHKSGATALQLTQETVSDVSLEDNKSVPMLSLPFSEFVAQLSPIKDWQPLSDSL